ncbi:hypothetical protein KC953_03505 [Candidatus Saccharibacteria bacterium]|nr:hypothetical protein [Candidatus Saccharibacteria bacterium]
MDDKNFVKEITRPYIGGILKTNNTTQPLLITSITQWGISSTERYIVVGCVPENFWTFPVRFEFRVMLQNCKITVVDDDKMLVIKTGSKEIHLYPPTHSLSNLWELYLAADAPKPSDNGQG